MAGKLSAQGLMPVRARVARATAVMIAAAALAACADANSAGAGADAGIGADAGAGGNDASFGESASRAAFTANLAEAVIVPTYEAFSESTDVLVASAEAWQASGDAADLLALQNAWRQAAAEWQRAEMFQFGPAGAMALAVGGEDLRDLLYSWPIDNPCRVDQELVDAQFSEGLSGYAVNVRGLDAMEYLLFGDASANACSPNSRINRDGSWEALGASVRATHRADYALALAQQLQQDAATLLGWWSADGEDFLREIRDAGQGSATFGTEREALNALTDALFYLEKETKDMKLAVPLGLIDCTTAACPERVESAHAGASLDHVRANLLGFDALFAGTDDVPGFEALLTDLGAGELADRMRSETQRAINAIDAIEMPLSVAVVQDPGAVLAVHEAVASVVRDLKTQFITTLDVEIPQRAEGDND